MQIQDPHKYFLLDQFNTNPAICFVIDKLSSSQKAFSLIKQINKYLEHYSTIELSIYSIYNEMPVVLSHTGIYNAGELNDFNGHAIATDLHTLYYVLDSDRPHKYLYLYDIHSINHLNDKQIKFLKDSNIKIFTRNNDYRQLLIQKSFEVSPILVPDFEIETILKICQ
jgi:hypothetical protein